LEKDLSAISRRERLLQAGVFVMGFSTLFFAFGSLEVGTLTLILGAVLALLNYEHGKKSQQLRDPKGSTSLASK